VRQSATKRECRSQQGGEKCSIPHKGSILRFYRLASSLTGELGHLGRGISLNLVLSKPREIILYRR
jgi:hypothetical protein